MKDKILNTGDLANMDTDNVQSKKSRLVSEGTKQDEREEKSAQTSACSPCS